MGREEGQGRDWELGSGTSMVRGNKGVCYWELEIRVPILNPPLTGCLTLSKCLLSGPYFLHLHKESLSSRTLGALGD